MPTGSRYSYITTPTKKKKVVYGPGGAETGTVHKSPLTYSQFTGSKGPISGKSTPIAKTTSLPNAIASTGVGQGMATGATNPYGNSTGNTSAGGAQPGIGSDISSPASGFMKQFGPNVQDTIWRDPQVVLNKMFQNSGQSTASPMYSTMRDFYGADPQSLWLLDQGNKQGNFGGANEYGNWLNSLYSNQMTPGGRGIDFNDILSMLAGQTDQSKLLTQDQSPLWQMLTAGSASDQARTMYGLLGDAGKAGLSPAVASAFMDALARQSDQYLTDNATTAGGAGEFYKYFNSPMQGR